MALWLLEGCGSSATSSPGGSPNPTPTPSSIDVTTYHYNNMRTGQNTQETALTTANVNPTKFGKLGAFMVDGKVDAQPLYLSNVSIPSQGMRNVLYVTTEHGSVFAFDADSISGNTTAPLWMVSTQMPGEVPSDDRGCGQVTPEIGITSTPVIDRGRGAIYVVAVSKDASGNYFHRIHALDLSTGKELFGGPTMITATYPGSGAGSSGGNVVFDPAEYNERPGLFEINGTIYTAWGSHCDADAYTSWVMAYSADTLQQLGAIDLVPSTAGGGIWLGGGGPSADASGNIYLATGNAFGWNTPGISGDYGDSVLKLSGSPPLTVLDYFAPSNAILNDNQDLDFGSAAPLLLPDLVDSSQITHHLAVAAGKDGVIYVIIRDNLGRYDPTKNNVYQQVPNTGHENRSSPVYFNSSVYLGPEGSPLLAFSISQALVTPTSSSQTANSFGGGTVPSVSANGTSNGIVWALDYTSGTLYAFDASDLTKQLYNSKQAAGGRDIFATVGGHFITPMVANGRVYVGTPNSVAVFGYCRKDLGMRRVPAGARRSAVSAA